MVHGILFSAKLVLVALAALSLSSCASARQGDAPQFDAIVMDRTPLYAQGPEQTTPPDAYLETGARLRIIAGGGDHAYVETVSGQTGFVERSKIREQGGL